METYPALAELRSQGVVKAIGVGITQWQMALRFAKEGRFDCFLLACRYTLLDQTALPEFLPYCQKNDISIILGGPYNSGILASDLKEGVKYDYRDASPNILEKARRIKTVCDRHDVPLKAAALQFVLTHPAVASVIPGSSYPEHVEDNFQMVQYPIPTELWTELRNEALISNYVQSI
jgi:D-threo-aldose 1-dehydrogenase